MLDARDSGLEPVQAATLADGARGIDLLREIGCCYARATRMLACRGRATSGPSWS
jgi:hypothetical protein